MQDDFNSAPTPADPRFAPQQRPRVQSGAAPPIYDPNVQPGQPDRTQTYHGPPPTADRPTSPTLPDVTQWSGGAGSASPYAPTVQRAPSIPKQPRGGAQALPPMPVPLRAPSAPRQSLPRPSAPVLSAPSLRRGRFSRWIPLSHTLLIAGVLLLALATRLPWGVDGSGSLITLQSAPSSSLQLFGGDGSALSVAYNLISFIAAVSTGLLFFNALLSGVNRVLGRGCLAGCVVAPLYPILLGFIFVLLAAQVLAAGFGGLGGLELTQSYGMGGAGVAHYELGYYAWYTGLILNVAGMLGEFVVWRR